jgi:hypothetical protein
MIFDVPMILFFVLRFLKNNLSPIFQWFLMHMWPVRDKIKIFFHMNKLVNNVWTKCWLVCNVLKIRKKYLWSGTCDTNCRPMLVLVGVQCYWIYVFVIATALTLPQISSNLFQILSEFKLNFKFKFKILWI